MYLYHQINFTLDIQKKDSFCFLLLLLLLFTVNSFFFIILHSAMLLLLCLLSSLFLKIPLSYIRIGYIKIHQPTHNNEMK